MIPITNRSIFSINQSNSDHNAKLFQRKNQKKISVKSKALIFPNSNRQGIINYPSFPTINNSENFSEQFKLKLLDQKFQQSKDKTTLNDFYIHRSIKPLFKPSDSTKNEPESEIQSVRKRIYVNNQRNSNKELLQSCSEHSATISKQTNSSYGFNNIADQEILSSVNPMTPQSVLKNYRSQLTSLEQEEIFNYQDIWFLGLHAMKTEAIRGTSPNNGYDDESGAYIKINHDQIAFRYEALETLGRGSFGQVVRAIDHQTGQEVAIKLIRNKKRFHQQALIEVAILKHLKKIDKSSQHGIHVIHIIDNFVFRNHQCIVFELLGENLYDVIKRNNFRGFSLGIIQKMAYALFTCLGVLRKENIIHCDIKPENILIKNKKCYDIKLIDFGSSCYSNQRVYTYIQSRFYRSPEVILGIPYTTQIDVWSLGCVLSELVTGRPLFPGENEMDQLASVIEVFGYPPKSLMELATRKRLFFDSKGEARNITNRKGRKKIPNSQTLQSIMKLQLDPKFIDLICQCLEWNPQKRITPEMALEHPWFSDLRSESSENISEEFKISLRKPIPKISTRGKETNKVIIHTNNLDKENLPPINTKRDNIESESFYISEKVELPSLYR